MWWRKKMMKKRICLLLCAVLCAFCGMVASCEEAESPLPCLDLEGRGRSDSGRSEPQYVGITGYIGVYPGYDNFQSDNDKCLKGDWKTTTYIKDKQFWVESEKISHKTQVKVLEQELVHEGWGRYSGYLFVECTDTEKQVWINVRDFITKPYWTFTDPQEAAKVGYCLATFQQVSDFYPVDRDGEKVTIKDGMTVLLTGKNNSGRIKGPNRETNQLEAMVYQKWRYGYGGVTVYFNQEDLNIIY